ncbi:MAG: tRNA dihydrouridine synthase [Candidatus Komeilibacteria bacterium]
MKKNFWQKLPRPFFALAPMADVTDAAFRHVIAKYGKPDIMFTEFVSCDGLCSAGKPALLHNFIYDHSQRPIVAQIFGSRPENFFESAKLVKQLGFDGIDINMGCPAKNIQKQYAGAELIQHPQLAQEIVAATKEGAANLPVSIKTRIGIRTNELETWLPALLATKPVAITIHARTRQQMSKVPADWNAIKQAVNIAQKSGVLIIGNGDVKDLDDARAKANITGAAGIMFGRAVFGNPWLFNKKINHTDISLKKKLTVLLEHTKLYDKLLGQHKNFAIMKKHFKAYVTGWPGAKELRAKLMATENVQQVEKIVKNYLNEHAPS